MLPIALAALCAWASATAVLETRAAVPLRIDRAVACRGVRDGLPFDAGRTFQIGNGNVCVWFAGREGSVVTRVTADVWREEPAQRVARASILVPPRSPGGVFTVGLESGAPLPAGAYRVHLMAPGTCATVRFAVVAGRADVSRVDAPRPRLLSDPALGFRFAAPPGWDDLLIEPAAFALLRAGAPHAVVMVLVRRAPSATTAPAVASQLAEALSDEVDYLVIKRREGRLGTRHTAAIVVDRADGERLKVVVIPREDGPTSRTFFGLMLTCKGADFESVEPEFDGIVSSFRILPLSPP